jgi:hypothetical protein
LLGKNVIDSHQNLVGAGHRSPLVPAIEVVRAVV